MPFDDPNEGSAFESPLEDGTYSLYCLGVSDDQDRGYGATMRWEFYVYDRTATEQVLRSDGEPYVLSVLSGTKITKSEKGNSKAYDWASALVGEPIDEVCPTGKEVSAAIQEKWALGVVLHNAKGWPQIPQDGLKPWTEPRQKAAAPAAAGPGKKAAARPAQPALVADDAAADAEPFD